MNPEVFENCSTILIDIAGTVGSKDYVKDTLFAFAKKNIEEYLKAKWEDEETKKLVAELKGDGDSLPDVSKAVERFNALTDENSNNTALKALQGCLYKQGYENGELKAHIFEDVKKSLDEWSKIRKICIYSTGTEEAQRQYFTHSTAGDLTNYIAQHFDQSVGVKTAPESYEKIANTLSIKPQEVVFLSDDIEEIKAAAKAGCVTVLVTREGNDEISEQDKTDRIVISSFTELPLNAKRKMPDEASSEGPPAKVAKLDTTTADKSTEAVAEKTEATESMEVDSSEATPATTESATPEAAPSAASTADEAKVETTTEVDTTEKCEAMETATTEESVKKTDEAAPVESTKDKEVDETQESKVDTSEKTDDKATETEPEKPAVETEASNEAVAAEEPKKTAEEAKPVAEEKKEEEKVEPETESKPETNEVQKAEAENGDDKVTENGSSSEEKKEHVKENGSSQETSAEVHKNGEKNGAEAEEKENKSEIANGTTEVTAESEKNASDANKEEVKVKKLDEPSENKAPVVVEA